MTMRTLSEDMMETFGLPPFHWCDGFFLYAGWLVIDPLKFETFLKRYHGLRVDESINECVERTWGKPALALLERAGIGEVLRNGQWVPREVRK